MPIRPRSGSSRAADRTYLMCELEPDFPTGLQLCKGRWQASSFKGLVQFIGGLDQLRVGVDLLGVQLVQFRLPFLIGKSRYTQGALDRRGLDLIAALNQGPLLREIRLRERLRRHATPRSQHAGGAGLDGLLVGEIGSQ